MAGKITHLEVLGQVIKHLDHGSSEQRDIAKLLSNQMFKRYANVGTIAPDIFYYYHVLSAFRTTRAQIWGDLHHHKNVVELVLNFLDLVKEVEEEISRSKLLAFTYGYICHCAVDVVTHPYIFYISGDYYNKDPEIAFMAQINHMKVEFALDSFLLNYRWGMSPEVYDFNQYVDIRKKNGMSRGKLDPLIWTFWLTALKITFPDEFNNYYIGSEKKIIPWDILNDSYQGFLDFHKVLDNRNSFIRGVLKFVDIITFHKIKSSVLLMPTMEGIDSRIMNEERRTWHYPALPDKTSKESFIELVNRAAKEAVLAISNADLYLNGNLKREDALKEYKGLNLDTGLRDRGIKKMTEFAPLQ
ncbi:MAG: zinc dependent phospholipase C family protein [Leptospiraceae bacterium]|nr:zinc dependent phospholipase C family protein [Leptospiraceae bacterium]